MARHVVLMMIFLAAAVVCYAVGMAYGIAVFIGFGLLFELMFWTGLWRRSTASEKSTL